MKKLNQEKTEVDNLEEWKFLKNCLSLGLSINDLKELRYIDVAMIMILTIKEQGTKEKKATQEDINKFFK